LVHVEAAIFWESHIGRLEEELMPHQFDLFAHYCWVMRTL
jgi:hypothetical protein